MTNFAPAFYRPNLFGVLHRVGLFAMCCMVVCSHGCMHLQNNRRVRVSCGWRFLCFSEPSKFLKKSVRPRSTFRAFVFCALFALRRCWIFVGLSFVGRACHSNAFLFVFDSASAFHGEKRQRHTHGAENSVGDASRFDADARTPLEFVVQIKFFICVCKNTGLRDEDAEQGTAPQRTGNELVVRRDPTLENSTCRSLSLVLSKSRKDALLFSDRLESQQSAATPTWRARGATLPPLSTVHSPRRYFSSVCTHQQKPA